MISVKPYRMSRLSYSASSRAPAIHPVQRSMLRRPSSDTGRWIVTSASWILPPGRRTRAISQNTAYLSGMRSITPFEMTTSKPASAKGSSSALPSTIVTFASPISAAERRAFAAMSGVMSIPVT